MGNIINFNGANMTDSVNIKEKIIGKTGNDDRKNVKIAVPLEHVSFIF